MSQSIRWMIFFIAVSMSSLLACGHPNSTSVDDMAAPHRITQSTDVTDAYGSLSVREGEFEAESAHKPWSSWWYPIKDKYLFQKNHGLSPLEKYDTYLARAHGVSGAATQYERDNVYDPNANGWE